MFGWQSPQLERGTFRPIPHPCPFVEILYMNDNHWIVVSNVNPSNMKYSHQNSFQIYDSRLILNLTPKYQEDYLKPRADQIHFEIKPFDCAVAYSSPALCSWDTKAMRSHLISWFYAAFPITTKRRIRLGRRLSIV